MPGEPSELIYLAPIDRALYSSELRQTPPPSYFEASVVFTISAWDPVGTRPPQSNEESASLAARNHARNRQLYKDLGTLSYPSPKAVWHAFRFNPKENTRADGFAVAFHEADRPKATDLMLELADEYGQPFVHSYRTEYGQLIRRRVYAYTKGMTYEEQQIKGDKEYIQVLLRPPQTELATREWAGSDNGGPEWGTFFNAWSRAILDWWWEQAGSNASAYTESAHARHPQTPPPSTPPAVNTPAFNTPSLQYPPPPSIPSPVTPLL